METQQLITNHTIDSLPPTSRQGEPSGPAASSLPPAAFDLAALMAKREQLIQGLNGARVQLETQAQSVTRTEGALMMVNQLISELDPDALTQRVAEGG